MAQFSWLIPLIPLLAFVLIVFITAKARLLSALLALASVGTSLVLSVWILVETIINPRTTEASIQWLNIPSIGSYKGLVIQMGYLIDPLSSIMLFIVSLVAFLVILYSFGYMKDDAGYSRYFAYLALFTFSMLGLVLANNYFMLFVFWELVGLSSYLLIGFWFHKDSAADAGQKAFITNRWADFGFMTGVILLFVQFGTFNFTELGVSISSSTDIGFLTLAGILIFMGTVGKSAQFPLHVWLPDAMEGPTPVSALIHAATMVAAGVYLIARCFNLFESVHSVMQVLAYVGGFTALFAATIALVQKDIKRILAFSTLSQLGYMVMAMGVGSMSAGMFHLTTHAFFKALLFLGAGSVIHVVHEQDIFKMGALSKKMPLTTWTFVIGALALSGIFPLAGFWSKDEILNTAFIHQFNILYILGTAVAFLTPFYMFRLIFVAFFGDKRSEHHAHESGWVMTLPLIILGVFSVFAGFINAPFFYQWTGKSFGTFLFHGEPEAPVVNMSVALVSTGVSLLGIFLAWLIYAKKIISIDKMRKTFSFVYNLLYNKYYIDELYTWLYRRIMLIVAAILDWLDHIIIDGLFDGFARLLKWVGSKLRLTQTGHLQTYALVLFTAVAVLILLLTTPLLGVFK